MPHPIYGKPKYTLEVIQLSLFLPVKGGTLSTRLEVSGRSSGKRTALWSYREMWGPHDSHGTLQPCDTAHWLLLAAAQDQPVNQEAFMASITPQGWEDVEIPFT